MTHNQINRTPTDMFHQVNVVLSHTPARPFSQKCLLCANICSNTRTLAVRVCCARALRWVAGYVFLYHFYFVVVIYAFIFILVLGCICKHTRSLSGPHFSAVAASLSPLLLFCVCAFAALTLFTDIIFDDDNNEATLAYTQIYIYICTAQQHSARVQHSVSN